MSVWKRNRVVKSSERSVQEVTSPQFVPSQLSLASISPSPQ